MSLHIASDLISEALHAAAAHARSTFLLLDLNSKRRDQKFDASAKIVDCKPWRSNNSSALPQTVACWPSQIARAHRIDTWCDA